VVRQINFLHITILLQIKSLTIVTLFILNISACVIFLDALCPECYLLLGKYSRYSRSSEHGSTNCKRSSLAQLKYLHCEFYTDSVLMSIKKPPFPREKQRFNRPAQKNHSLHTKGRRATHAFQLARTQGFPFRIVSRASCPRFKTQNRAP
jgi:hypothetical protein